MGWLRRVLFGLSSLLLFVSIWILWPQELDGFLAGRDGMLAVPDYAMTNARFVSVRGGRVEMETRARDTIYDLGERRMRSETVSGKFFNADGKITNISADETLFLQNERKALFTGHVRAESPDGFVLTGHKAEYFMDKRFLLAPEPVAGEGEGGAVRVWGRRAESYLDQRKLALVGDARAEFREKKRGLTKIRGDRADVDRATSEIAFAKNVRVNQGETVGTSDRATINYAPRERNLSYMALLDDVTIRDPGGRYTRSQVAEFFAPSDTIILSGFPAVYRGDDAITGDKITLYRTTGVVEVTQTNAAAAGLQPQLDRLAPPKRPLTKEDEELIP